MCLHSCQRQKKSSRRRAVLFGILRTQKRRNYRSCALKIMRVADIFSLDWGEGQAGRTKWFLIDAGGERRCVATGFIC